MIPPSILPPIRKALPHSNPLRKGMIRDTDIRRVEREVIERRRRIRYSPVCSEWYDAASRPFGLGDCLELLREALRWVLGLAPPFFK